ncbi:MAG: hypothetical protein A2284_11340 [Deltaproteobacteria bacterium RIFOXYA12_FULL_61_11]|nr:MAG: hypothetical protein A2284_11340 [Deltaproteobacteria bacterium RIFOXYA12_FULL_61_11]
MTERLPTLEEAFLEHHRAVFNLAWHCVGDRSDAEDLTQEVFLRYAERRGSLTLDLQLKAWLYRVAVNRCIDRKRRFARSLAKLARWKDQREVERAGERGFPGETTLLAREVLATFDATTRVLIVLKYVEELEYQEIAELTGISVTALKVRLHRALERVRQRRNLEEEPEHGRA